MMMRNILCAVLAMSATGASAADITDRLRPSQTELPAPHALAECHLPAFGEPIPALEVNGQIPKRLDLPPQYVIVLLALFVSPTQADDTFLDARELPLLPDGGIVEADWCSAIETQKMVLPDVGERFGIVGLRLRPSLDLAARYPTFGPRLAESGRVVRTKPKTFAAYRTFPGDEEILREALNGNPLVTGGTTMWTMPGLILVPYQP